MPRAAAWDYVSSSIVLLPRTLALFQRSLARSVHSNYQRWCQRAAPHASSWGYLALNDCG